ISRRRPRRAIPAPEALPPRHHARDVAEWGDGCLPSTTFVTFRVGCDALGGRCAAELVDGASHRPASSRLRAGCADGRAREAGRGEGPWARTAPHVDLRAGSCWSPRAGGGARTAAPVSVGAVEGD